jgi:hypothetical protein
VRRRPALFDCLWYDTQTGHALHRATAAELAEAHRLWWRHRDLREKPCSGFGGGGPGTESVPTLEDVVADEWTQIGIDSLGAA